MMNTLSGHVLSPADQVSLPGNISCWTHTDFDIVQTLTLRIRLMASTQATQIWQTADRRLSKLVAAGLIERHKISVHPRLQPDRPLAAWVPGHPEPPCNFISRSARARWTTATITTEVFVASRKASNLFGSDSHGLPPVEHRDHDLLLADAYAFYREQRPGLASRWIGEDFLPKAGFKIKDPDAFLVDDDGQFRCVIESAGRYSTHQVKSFHDYCVVHNLPYELW